MFRISYLDKSWKRVGKYDFLVYVGEYYHQMHIFFSKLGHLVSMGKSAKVDR